MSELPLLARSSGDLIADRRAGYAEMLFASGDQAAAAEVMAGALELAPGWAMGWYRLGEMFEAAGALDAAAEAWHTSLKLEPADRPGARLKLELIGRAPAAAAPPSRFVEALFDDYAEKFEHSLVRKLGYRVPELLFAALETAAGSRRFRHAVDLGCGTGLMGEKLRPVSEFLEGTDLSAAMLKKAAAKNIYDRLAKADLQSLLLPAGAVDLITAADVFIYLGALEGVATTVANGLEPGGVFAFSVEAHDGPEDFALRPSRRYAHSESYVRRVLEANGLILRLLSRETIRMDRGEPIAGLIAVAERG